MTRKKHPLDNGDEGLAEEFLRDDKTPADAIYVNRHGQRVDKDGNLLQPASSPPPVTPRTK